MEYNLYCNLLEYYCLNRLDEGVLSGISDAVLGVFKNIKQYVVDLATKFKVSVLDIVNALKQKDVFAFLKAFGFNFTKILDYIKKAHASLKSGIDAIFMQLSKSGIVKQLQSGAMKIDDLLNKYPLLKSMTGPVLAGLLIYIWMHMSFTGDFADDFNISNILGAISGKFTITDLFLSPSGLKFLTLYATGSLITFPWLFATFPTGLIVALIYTGYKKLKKNPEILKKIQTGFKTLVSENEVRMEIRKILREIKI